MTWRTFAEYTIRFYGEGYFEEIELRHTLAAAIQNLFFKFEDAQIELIAHSGDCDIDCLSQEVHDHDER